MSPKNYFFLLFTFYFGSFTKSKIKIKGKRQCGIKWGHFRLCLSILKVSHIKKMHTLHKEIIYRLVLIDSQDFSKQYLMTKENPGISVSTKVSHCFTEYKHEILTFQLEK